MFLLPPSQQAIRVGAVILRSEWFLVFRIGVFGDQGIKRTVPEGAGDPESYTRKEDTVITGRLRRSFIAGFYCSSRIKTELTNNSQVNNYM